MNQPTRPRSEAVKSGETAPAVTAEPPLITATVRINPQGIVNAAALRIRNSIAAVAFGLRAGAAFKARDLSLPGIKFPITIGDPSEDLQVASVAKEFATWILAGGLQEVLDAFSGSLEIARQDLAFYSLTRTPESVDAWNKIWEEKVDFHRLGLPQKLRYLEKRYGVTLLREQEIDLLSLNRARNCLVHRQGVVRMADLGTSDSDINRIILDHRTAFPEEKWSGEQEIRALQAAGESACLEVSWIANELSILHDGVTRIIDPRLGAVVEPGSVIAWGIRRESRSFLLGTRVQFSVDDFSEIAFTAVNATIALRDLVRAYGTSLGVQDATPVDGSKLSGRFDGYISGC